MPEFLQDPSVLTKEKLKSELVANSVSLPTGEQRKEVYVKLYLQHLTARNRGTPDFSSDEEREATPVRGRGRPPGRKATKKTDKPSVEEKPDKPSIEELPEQDVTELTNEALKEELLKYGITHGPILANTRKLYEKKVIKAKEQVTSITSVVDTSNTDSNKQNGNSDPEHYSDNEESKIDLTFETREPIRAKSKAQITSRSRRLEQNETEEDTEEVVLNVKRETRLPPEDFVTEIEEFSTILCSISGDGNPEPEKTVEPEKVGRVQAISREESRVVRRTPRKRVVAAEPLPDDDADVSESPPITETILPSSNQAPVDNQVTETFKHTNALRSFIELSELSRRTPKKQPISEKIVEKTFTEEKREDRNVLKEMFPYETLTPTGISATCRRPIKGAAGRPFSMKDYKIEEGYTSKYVSKYQPLLEQKVTKPKTGRSIPMWIKILIFIVLAVFLFLVYQVMETNEGNPFSLFQQVSQSSNTVDN
ncbi:thymopoietin isoform X4 [Rana temporaria]|uniref:thymopoietin isoform X4 n=1 Tax=Rana temporaria TaxID=8407 RepID=UPI001AAC74E2|nr:thymopoietin isoform X4 [Rana temporaria]